MDSMKSSDDFISCESHAMGCGCGCSYHSTYFLQIINNEPGRMDLVEYKYNATVTNSTDYSYDDTQPTVKNITIMSMFEYIRINGLEGDFCHDNAHYHKSSEDEPHDPNEIIKFDTNFKLYNEYMQKNITALKKYIYHSGVSEYDWSEICTHIDTEWCVAESYWKNNLIKSTKNVVTELACVINILKHYKHHDIIEKILSVLDELFIKNIDHDVFLVYNEISDELISHCYFLRKNDIHY